jgi:hypothetical protein
MLYSETRLKLYDIFVCFIFLFQNNTHYVNTDTFSGLLLRDQIGFLFPYTVYAEPYAEEYLDPYYDDGPGQGDHTGSTFQEHNNYWTGNL